MRITLVIAVATAALALSACGDDDDESTDVFAGGTPRPGEPIPLGRIPEGDPRAGQELYGDDITTGGGYVWVLASGEVHPYNAWLVRIDPESRSVEGEPIPIYDEQGFEIEYADGALWVTITGGDEEDELLRIDDPAVSSPEITLVKPGTDYLGVRLATDGESLWVKGGEIARIAPGADHGEVIFDDGIAFNEIAYAEGSIWGSGSRASGFGPGPDLPDDASDEELRNAYTSLKLLRINAESGADPASVKLPFEGDLVAADTESVWVTEYFGSRIQRVSLETDELAGGATNLAGVTDILAVDAGEGGMWAVVEKRPDLALVALDPETGEPFGRPVSYGRDSFPRPYGPYRGGANLAVGEGGVWIADEARTTVLPWQP